MAQFVQNEQKDAVRFSWNVFPSSRLEATRLAVPLGCMYSPIKQIPGLGKVGYTPIFCKNTNCGACLNPYCRVDFINKIWVCPFCITRNNFPHNYADISTENRPAEILPQYTTLEYLVEPGVGQAPVYIFVLDTVVIEEELDQAKQSILQSLMLLPENAKVGLVTFGQNVHIHELSFDDCPKSYVFRGSRELKSGDIATFLGFNKGKTGNIQQQQMYHQQQADRFLMPVSECEFQLNSILEDLTKDSWPTKKKCNAERCSGTALAVAIGLLEATYKEQNGRVMMFMGGPPNIGGGQVCSTDATIPIRSHHDIQKGDAPFYKKAKDYYTELAKQAADNGHIIDIFACALDQVGLAEMRVCVEMTGGFLVLDDSFTRGVFLNSLQRVFATAEEEPNPDGSPSLLQCFGGEVEVLTSREFKCCGAIGACTSLARKSQSVADSEIGIGGTNAWKLGGLHPNSTIAMYFEVVNTNAEQVVQEQRQAYIQFRTKYKNSKGQVLLRVTTVARTFADPKTDQGMSFLRAGFDQEAAAVLMTRYAVFKTNNEYTFDILRWLDRMLIRLVSKFATYVKDDPNSFQLSPELHYYPQFMFHLRRSQFLQVFNSSPDETAFFRAIVINESVTNTLIMIQPTLMSYSLDGPAAPVQLDVSSLGPERILVLDTFFHYVIWYGDTIVKWQADGIHLKPEYDYFAQLLNAPKNDAASAMDSRLPYPRFIECIDKGSQARFLMAKLNPSVTQSTMQAGYENGEPPVFTEDVSLKVFLTHLCKLAVQS